MFFTEKECMGYLAGAWRVFRKIQYNGYFVGVAYFAGDPNNRLYYYEKGFYVTAQNKKIMTYRDYWYCLENNKINVYFSENGLPSKLFYSLEISNKNIENETTRLFATGQHLCLQDFYDATYFFLEKNQFILIYHVVGPKKDFFHETYFSRIL